MSPLPVFTGPGSLLNRAPGEMPYQCGGGAVRLLVLLTKADKLNRREADAALQGAQDVLGAMAGEQADIGHAQARETRPEARHVNGLKTFKLDQPRGEGIGLKLLDDPQPLEIGKGRVVKQGSAVAILSYGTRLQECLLAAEMLDKHGLSTTVADARFAKPLDEALLADLAKYHEVLITIEEGARGGFGAFVLHSLSERGLLDGGLRIRTLTLPDIFQDHDTLERMYELAGLDARSIAASAIKALGRGDERALKLIVG